MNSSSKELIRVLIADDHPVIREGLAAILKSSRGIKVVAEAADGEEACELSGPGAGSFAADFPL